VTLAAHSIDPDIAIENYDWAIEVYRRWREAKTVKTN